MANKKKEYYKPGPMTEGKRNIIQGLLQEYLCVRNGEERSFTAAEFKTAQVWLQQNNYGLPHKRGEPRLMYARHGQ